MSGLLDMIQGEETPLETLTDPEYQANMYLIESALRETGDMVPALDSVKSPYDAELIRLINAVPMR